jgi:hypothetical protein
MIPKDPKTLRVLKLFFLGFGVKCIGYLIIAIGIFSGLKDQDFGLKVIYAGIAVVAVGWVILYIAVRESKKP